MTQRGQLGLVGLSQLAGAARLSGDSVVIEHVTIA
jgi:hypothetical protein